MSTRRGLLLLALGSALVWIAANELFWPARLLTVLLLVVLPAVLVLQASAIRDPTALPRLPVYASSALAQLLLALFTLIAARTSGFRSADLGLVLPSSWLAAAGWAVGITVLASAMTWIGHLLGVRESALLYHLLPRNRQERLAFLALSLVAGCCEELIFRGFLISAVNAASGSTVVALLVSSAAFGIVHAYQEPGGVARATLLGLVLATPFVITGGLFASMLAHAAIDVIGGWWLGPRLLPSSR